MTSIDNLNYRLQSLTAWLHALYYLAPSPVLFGPMQQLGMEQACYSVCKRPLKIAHAPSSFLSYQFLNQ